MAAGGFPALGRSLHGRSCLGPLLALAALLPLPSLAQQTVVNDTRSLLAALQDPAVERIVLTGGWDAVWGQRPAPLAHTPSRAAVQALVKRLFAPNVLPSCPHPKFSLAPHCRPPAGNITLRPEEWRPPLLAAGRNMTLASPGAAVNALNISSIPLIMAAPDMILPGHQGSALVE